MLGDHLWPTSANHTNAAAVSSVSQKKKAAVITVASAWLIGAALVSFSLHSLCPSFILLHLSLIIPLQTKLSKAYLFCFALHVLTLGGRESSPQ